jgi:hypothetical protein
MSPFVLMICMLQHCQYLDMPSEDACNRSKASVESSASSTATILCIDRRRSEDPDEK